MSANASPHGSLRSTMILTGCLLLLSVFASNTNAQTVGLLPYPPQERAQIRSMPITERPNRPLHFYGNAVRRGIIASPGVQVRVNVRPIAPAVNVRVRPAPLQRRRWR